MTKELKQQIKKLGYKIRKVRHNWVLFDLSDNAISLYNGGIFECYAVEHFAKELNIVLKQN